MKFKKGDYLVVLDNSFGYCDGPTKGDILKVMLIDSFGDYLCAVVDRERDIGWGDSDFEKTYGYKRYWWITDSRMKHVRLLDLEIDL